MTTVVDFASESDADDCAGTCGVVEVQKKILAPQIFEILAVGGTAPQKFAWSTILDGLYGVDSGLFHIACHDNSNF